LGAAASRDSGRCECCSWDARLSATLVSEHPGVKAGKPDFKSQRLLNQDVYANDGNLLTQVSSRLQV
jgi:hypothetical protein